MRPLRPPRSSATGIASLLVLGVGLTALFLGVDWFWVVFAIGFAVVVPLVSVLAGEDDPLDETDAMLDGLGSSSTSTSTSNSASSAGETRSDDAITTLRARYARGELTEAQFERKVETLLETETLEAVEDRARRRQRVGADPDDSEPPTHTPETDRETA